MDLQRLHEEIRIRAYWCFREDGKWPTNWSRISECPLERWDSATQSWKAVETPRGLHRYFVLGENEIVYSSRGERAVKKYKFHLNSINRPPIEEFVEIAKRNHNPGSPYSHGYSGPESLQQNRFAKVQALATRSYLLGHSPVQEYLGLDAKQREAGMRLCTADHFLFWNAKDYAIMDDFHLGRKMWVGYGIRGGVQRELYDSWVETPNNLLDQRVAKLLRAEQLEALDDILFTMQLFQCGDYANYFRRRGSDSPWRPTDSKQFKIKAQTLQANLDKELDALRVGLFQQLANIGGAEAGVKAVESLGELLPVSRKLGHLFERDWRLSRYPTTFPSTPPHPGLIADLSEDEWKSIHREYVMQLPYQGEGVSESQIASERIRAERYLVNAIEQLTSDKTRCRQIYRQCAIQTYGLSSFLTDPSFDSPVVIPAAEFAAESEKIYRAYVARHDRVKRKHLLVLMEGAPEATQQWLKERVASGNATAKHWPYLCGYQFILGQRTDSLYRPYDQPLSRHVVFR